MRKIWTAVALAAALIAAPVFAQEKKPGAAPAAAPAAEKKADKKAEPMDINSASEKELATLPGIGEARAKAIVKGRPYKGKNELLDKKIIPENVYNDIKEKIIAKQAEPKKEEKKK